MARMQKAWIIIDYHYFKSFNDDPYSSLPHQCFPGGGGENGLDHIWVTKAIPFHDSDRLAAVSPASALSPPPARGQGLSQR